MALAGNHCYEKTGTPVEIDSLAVAIWPAAFGMALVFDDQAYKSKCATNNRDYSQVE